MSWQWFFRLTGGRPMRRAPEPGFKDCVSGETVHYWTDRLGRRWLALGPWSWFRVEVRREKGQSLFVIPLTSTAIRDRRS